MTFHLIPHTHWDREWYLPLALFQARLVAVVDAALELLEHDESQRVTLDGQTVLLEDYLTLRPEAEERIRAQVSRGALEIGPWYVLGDELIPSGESLIRNLLEGAEDARRFGGRSRVLYSPDAFGHPAILPTLGREFGLEFGALWRGMGNPAGADRDLYRWIGPDGASLLLYHLPPAGYEAGIGPAHDRSKWQPLADALRDRAVTSHVAVFTGADHHLIPDLSPLREAEPGIRISTLGEFMRAVDDVAPAWAVQGELRRTGHTWVLQGVHGTRSRMKRAHGSVELALTRIAEPLAALSAFERGASPDPVLRHAWRLLLQSQFHDTIGGCSADAVTATQELRLRDVGLLAYEAGARAFEGLLLHDPDAADDPDRQTGETLALWNPAARTRDGIVTAEVSFFRRDVIVGPPDGRAAHEGPGFEPFTLMDGVTPVPVQVLAVRTDMDRIDARRHSPDQDEVDRVFVAFRAPDMPGLGTATLGVLRRPQPLDERGVTVSRDRLANRFVDARVSPVGVIDITDNESGEQYGSLAALGDETDQGDTYTFSRGPGRPVRGGRPITQSVLASGPLLGAVETRWELAAASGGTIAVRQIVVLHEDSALVRVRLEIDNHARDHRLRARFPIGAGHDALAGAALGFERRTPVDPGRRALIEQPVLTAPAHRYVAAGEGRRALAIFAPAFFEYEWSGDKELLVTLVRSIGELSRPELPERPGHAGWPEAVPLAQEPGLHRVDLALLPLGAGELEHPEQLEERWEEAFLPIQSRCYRGFTGGAWPGGLGLEGQGLVVSAIKPGLRGSLVLRCWNARDVAVEGCWVSIEPIATATLLRADESELEALPLFDQRVTPFVAAPRSIVTIRLTREQG